MADNRGSSRRSSRRGPQRPKTPQRNVTGNSKSKPTSSRNRNRSTPRGRPVIVPQSRVTSLPSDLWTLLLPFLTWRDTDAMLCVCCEWRKVVSEAKKSFPEWRSTVLGPSANGSESLELLRANHLKWADTRFAPDLVLLSAASQDCSPWHSGGYWEEAIAAIEGAKLLPPRCKIVGLFTMNSVLGRPEEDEDVEEDPTGSSAVTLSISIAHLPETTLEMAEFDRKDLRRYHHELENPFTSLEERDTPSFLMFGVNDQSARHLVPAVEQWHPGAAVVGAVSPLVDRCVPLATYSGGVEARKPRKNRGAKQQAARRPRPPGQVAFPSTILLRLQGKVGVKAFSSSGYHPITPVVRCEGASALDNFSQVMAYDLVSIVGQDEVEQHHIVDLLEPTERLAIDQEDQTLNIFSCREIAPLRHLSNCCRATESDFVPVATSADIERLEFVTPWWNNLVMSVPGLYWQEGTYGILASHHPTRTSQALTNVLQSTQAGLSSASERALGAFLVAGALNEVEDAVHAKDVSKLVVDTFRGLQIGGCIVRISVGPVALPGGLQLPVGRNVAQVQAHTTCGAIFYTKA
ncbi:hypothetical protein PF005_g19879 [Phytophthora fragariae]|uniref:F-box domain-containing protein n=2 Tax=Phytophthora TaxID=4783 RepID=A0A6A4CKB6_9STRA|nr:hypothetical protein PF003_g6967 [Phytophthora fragariae]KAE8928984.1 hypothetical protein PF009_g20898 [Phytophthora fragariae]KAE9089277.1 hypothetical protein PF007_g19659 [Phytophthora fragariae]KAE9090558.1 hypothetical protein PF010_g18543 [Phytophthora fragariae]KAE9116811.1 hypothetical protein PF006_g18956 [Phytophthora fragariae]